MGLFATISINDIRNSIECSCAVIMLSFAFFIVDLSFIKLSVAFLLLPSVIILRMIMLNISMLNIIMLNIIMLSFIMLSFIILSIIIKMCSSSVIWCHYICPGVIASLEVFCLFSFNFQIKIFNLIFQLVSHRYLGKVMLNCDIKNLANKQHIIE